MRDESACVAPFAAVKVFGIGQGAFEETDALDGRKRCRREVGKERDDAFDVGAEVEDVVRVEDVGGFDVNLAVCAENRGVDAGVLQKVVG